MFVEKNKDNITYKCKEYTMQTLLLYENFIEETLEKMLNIVITPISFNSSNLIFIKNKYSHLIKPQTTYRRKSDKINYEALNQITMSI
jgi:hypothetical protein